jgi:hypothetical protein
MAGKPVSRGIGARVHRDATGRLVVVLLVNKVKMAEYPHLNTLVKAVEASPDDIRVTVMRF